MQNLFPEAMAAFDRSDEISGNSDVANLGRAQALAAQNRYGEALSTMLKGRTVKTSTDLQVFGTIPSSVRVQQTFVCKSPSRLRGVPGQPAFKITEK